MVRNSCFKWGGAESAQWCSVQADTARALTEEGSAGLIRSASHAVRMQLMGTC